VGLHEESRDRDTPRRFALGRGRSAWRRLEALLGKLLGFLEIRDVGLEPGAG